jgi:hypothetical protein
VFENNQHIFLLPLVIIINELIMSALPANRVQSAYPRSVRQSSTNVPASHVEQRPVSSMGTQRSHTDVFDPPPWRKLESSTPSGIKSSYFRPKTGSISSTASAPLSIEQLHSNEMDSLLRSLDRDEPFIVQVDCLADYRKLVQTINLRQTPLDCKSLCTLQQRENRIVQGNACRDARFRSLLDILEPTHVIKVKENNSNNADRNTISEYQS